MTEQERSLMQAVLHNPFDDLPRLILADWYEENDQSDRANFIRIQIRQHHINPNFRFGNCMGDGACGSPCPYDGGKLCPFCDDLQEQSGLPASVFGEDKFFFGRGFIDEIRCTQADFIGSMCVQCAGHGLANCKSCNGVGSIGGIAKRVGESWPVTKVVITDAIVHSSYGADYFYLGGLGMFPSKYWKALDNHRSRLDVRDALGRVCVSYMRELANLPPLDGFTF